jgi:hypothetical protein
MEPVADESMTGSMVVFIALTALVIALSALLRESAMIRGKDADVETGS